MSINLDLQNWHDASFPLPTTTTTPSALLQMMNRSATEEDEQYGSNMKSSQPVFNNEQQQQQQMLSFSAGSHKVPHFYNNPASHYINPDFTGYNNYDCGGATSMHDLFNGPFTPSQWIELEQQALIYKHITSNTPFPSSTLLTPVRRASNHAAFSRYNFGHFPSMGWGGFQLGLQNSNDPEPGRCRRTDGKKWRCSRDAVTDQKYCERHINRGRHRSRKPVEGQSHYSIGKPLSTLLPENTDCPPSIGSNPDKRKISHNRQGNSASVVPISRKSCDARVCVDSLNLLVPEPSLALHPRQSLYNIHNNSKPADTYEQLFESDFGLVSSDALKNPSGQCIRPHSPSMHRFIDDCPKNQPDHTNTMWPNLNDTQLSISMPIGLQLGGNKHSYDHQPESDDNDPNWIPTLRDSIVGGPLGEVLQNSSGTSTNYKDGWDKGPKFALSPTGVLRKEAAFASRTNSSAGSSPRGETNMVGIL